MPRRVDVPTFEGSESEQYIAAATSINRAFFNGKTASDVLEELRSLPRPTLVDFNNVLTGDLGDKPNPKAYTFLGKIREVSNIIICTTAYGSEGVQWLLRQHRLDHPGMVIMANENYSFVPKINEAPMTDLLEDYFRFSADLGYKYTKEDLGWTIAHKNVASLFRRPFEVPLVDDSLWATESNQGILGIPVVSYQPERPRSKKRLARERLHSHTLNDAANLVVRYYSGLPVNTKIRPTMTQLGVPS